MLTAYLFYFISSEIMKNNSLTFINANQPVYDKTAKEQTEKLQTCLKNNIKYAYLLTQHRVQLHNTRLE